MASVYGEIASVPRVMRGHGWAAAPDEIYAFYTARRIEAPTTT
jgi:hypothetical protein